MANGLDLIVDALDEIQAHAAGETVEGPDSAIGLSRANFMLETFGIEGLMIFENREDVYLLPANVQSPTIGASGTFIATRPNKVTAANVIELGSSLTGTGATTGAGDSIFTDATKNFTTEGVVAGRDLLYVISGTGVTAGIYRISTAGTTTLTLSTNPGSSGSVIAYRVILNPVRNHLDVSRDVDFWSTRYQRGTSGIPTDLYHQASYPDATLNLYPVYSDVLALELYTWRQLTAITLAGTLSMPPGYYECCLYNLAMRLCAPFGRPLTPELERMAALSRAKVKSLNSKPPRIDLTGNVSNATDQRALRY